MKKLTTKQKAKNAIKWIKGLKMTKLNQQKGQLGDIEEGFCCLGFGCHHLKVDYSFDDADNEDFAQKVGLLDTGGTFRKKLKAKKWPLSFEAESLISLNDDFDAPFKLISKIMREEPELMFEAPVAKLIKEEFSK